MTKVEYGKCVSLMEHAIKAGNEAVQGFNEYNTLINQPGKEVEAEVKMRYADQHYGECLGINQVLVTLGFEHERMAILSELL